MEIRIQSAQTTVVNGESIQIELSLRNAGADTLTLPALDDPAAPQPYFVIQGPSFPKPYRFHWRGQSAHAHEGHSHHAPPQARPATDALVHLAAGASTQANFTLPVSLVLGSAGVHEVQASYEWQGATAQSNRIGLKVQASGPPLFRLVGRTPLLHQVGIQALSVQGEALYLATFDEDRPDLGEVNFLGYDLLTTVEAGATDFFAPWCQTAVPGLVGPRFGWRSGNSITVAGYHKLPQRLQLGYTPRLHAPSLMGANGDIEVLVSDVAGARLSLLRFPHVDYDQPPPPARVVWTLELPEPMIDLVASINPTGLRRALLRQASSVRLLAWDDGAPKLGAPASFTGRPVAEVAPALHVSAAGVVRGTVLSADPANRRKVALTQFTWQASPVPQVAAAAPFELQSPVRAGTIAYSMRSVEAPRREWVFVLESHRVLTSRSDGQAYISKRQVLLPPQLIVMERLSYDLELHVRPELNLLQ